MDKFQFHSGSIRASTTGIFCARNNSSFNSTLVRLGPEKELKQKEKDIMFQFHSGSIRAYLKTSQASASEMFQFHSGSIRAWNFSKISHCLIWFQFHSGSIRATRINTILDAGEERFNSTLVRLGLDFSVFEPLFVLLFQFHSGSIRAVAVAYLISYVLLVSIPLWFD